MSILLIEYVLCCVSFFVCVCTVCMFVFTHSVLYKCFETSQDRSFFKHTTHKINVKPWIVSQIRYFQLRSWCALKWRNECVVMDSHHRRPRTVFHVCFFAEDMCVVQHILAL